MKRFIIALSLVWFVTFGGCHSIQTKLPLTEILVSKADADTAEPAVAADSAGNIYVLDVEHGANKTADVFVQKITDDGTKESDKVRINPNEGQATAWRGDPPTIKIGTDNRVYVGWTARVETAEGNADDLYLSVSRDGGKNFDAPVKVNDDRLPAVHGMHSLEIDKTGRIYLAWLDERYLQNGRPVNAMPPLPQPTDSSAEMKHNHAEPNREVYFAVSNDGGKSFSANKKIAENVCPCCKTSMETAPDGRLYVSWRQVLNGDFRHIAVSSSIDGGNSFSPPIIVSDDRWQISGCPVSGAGMSVDKNNLLKIVWFTAGTAGTPGIYQAESSDGGKSFSGRKLITDKMATGTPVILADPDGKYQVIAGSTDGNTYILATQDSADAATEQNTISAADLPNAAAVRDKAAIAFVRKVGEKRQVFLSILKLHQ